MRTRLRARIGVAVLAATSMVLAACSSTSNSAEVVTSGAGKAPAVVRFAGILPSAPFAAEYAARGSTGAFAEIEKKFGTKFEYTTVGSPQDSASFMLGGSADVSFATLYQYLVITATGKEVVAVMAPFVGGGGVMIGAKKYEQSRGTDLSTFKGATFGYTREGSASQLFMQDSVEKAGISWKDVPHVAFGTPSAGLPLLQAGRLDVVATDPTTASKAIGAGTAYLIRNFNDPKTSGNIANQLGTVYGLKKEFTQQYPELTAAIVQGLAAGLKAVQAVADDPAAVLALFPTDIQDKVKDGWQGSWELALPGVRNTDGSMTPQAVTDTVDLAQKFGQLNAKQAEGTTVVINNTYLK